jgi:hypothetical protein
MAKIEVRTVPKDLERKSNATLSFQDPEERTSR